MSSIAVLGLGLIGGSLLRRLAISREVVGYDVAPEVRQAARTLGLPVADSVAAAVGDADVVVLAVPLPAFPALLPQVVAAAPRALVTDVASVKAPVRELARAARIARFVGGHPMAGTERSGFEASDPELFAGAPWVLCLEEETDLAGWLELAALWTALGCRVVPSTAVEHDLAVARISHLPHVLAAALAAAGADGGDLALKLAAGSFRDGTRVAGTRPELTAAMCESNSAALAVALDATLDRLTAARDALRAGEPIGGLVRAGYDGRHRWVGSGMGGQEVRLDLDAAGLRDQLLELGRSGGHVVEAGRDSLIGWRPEK